MVIIKRSQARVAHLLPDAYPVTCVGVREDTLQNPKYGKGEVVYLELLTQELDPETGEPIVLDKMCNKVWSPKSSLWSAAIALGLDPERMGTDLDTDLLHGHSCLATVRDETGSDGRTYSKVDALTKLPNALRAAMPPPPQTLAEQLHQRAADLSRDLGERGEYPNMDILKADATGIDFDKFWDEAEKRGITTRTLALRLQVASELVEQALRRMTPFDVIQLLVMGP